MYFSEQGNVDDDATFITILLVSFNLQSCCLMQSAVCSLQSAACGLRSAVCGLRSAVCSLQSANVIHRVKWNGIGCPKIEKVSQKVHNIYLYI